MTKDNFSRPHVVYNAIMLIRILSDNPGATFTRHIDSKFVSTVKDVLRSCKDPSVQQMLRETLNALYAEKGYDTGFAELFKMWEKERSVETGRLPIRPANMSRISSGQRSQRSVPARNALPGPAELAARIEEARTSAKLLQQLVQSTPPRDLQGNDLVKEFAERCQTAQRSMQEYLNCDNPPPDDDTMQTLIETSEQLSLASSKHSRAVLQARRSENTLGVPASVSTPTSGVSSLSGHPSPESNNYGLPYGVTTGSSPPRMVSPQAPVGATFVPAGSIPAPIHTGYAAPPVPPMSTMRPLSSHRDGGAPLNAPEPERPSYPNRMSGYGIPARASGAYDNPFGDDHAQEHPDDHDDLYNESPVAQRRSIYNSVPAINTTSPTNRHVDGAGSPTSASTPRQPHRPAPLPAESWRRPERVGPDGSYAPGYRSTPSYLHRQESSGDKLTMSGATGSPPAAMHGNPAMTADATLHRRPVPTPRNDDAVIQEHEVDEEDDEEEDPTTPVSEHSPRYRPPPNQRPGQPQPYEPYRAMQGGVIPTTLPRHSVHNPNNMSNPSQYTNPPLSPSERLDNLTNPSAKSPTFPRQDHIDVAPTTQYNRYSGGNPYHDELNLQGVNSAGVPQSYLNQGSDSGVHRSNTLSTIMSESEYAPSIRGGRGRGYDER